MNKSSSGIIIIIIITVGVINGNGNTTKYQKAHQWWRGKKNHTILMVMTLWGKRKWFFLELTYLPPNLYSVFPFKIKIPLFTVATELSTTTPSLLNEQSCTVRLHTGLILHLIKLWRVCFPSSWCYFKPIYCNIPSFCNVLDIFRPGCGFYSPSSVWQNIGSRLNLITMYNQVCP